MGVDANVDTDFGATVVDISYGSGTRILVRRLHYNSDVLVIDELTTYQPERRRVSLTVPELRQIVAALDVSAALDAIAKGSAP